MLDALPRGKANAVTTKVLTERTGWSARDVQLAIERLRQDGVPVCSNGDGYWIAESAADALAWERSQARRIRSLLATMRGVRRWRRRVEGTAQQVLW